MKPLTENIIEQSALETLQSLGWDYANGREISPEGLFCEKEVRSLNCDFCDSMIYMKVVAYQRNQKNQMNHSSDIFSIFDIP